MAKSYKDTEGRGQQEIVYLVCPLCARNRVLEARSDKAKEKGKGRIRWDFFDPETSPLVQVRQAEGKLPAEEQPTNLKRKPGMAKAAGFRLKRTLTWQQAKASEEFADQIEAIKQQLRNLESLLK